MKCYFNIIPKNKRVYKVRILLFYMEGMSITRLIKKVRDKDYTLTLDEAFDLFIAEGGTFIEFNWGQVDGISELYDVHVKGLNLRFKIIKEN